MYSFFAYIRVFRSPHDAKAELYLIFLAFLGGGGGGGFYTGMKKGS